MMEVTLHPTPRWRDVVLEQIRIAGLSLRIEALVVGAVLAAGTFIIGVDIVGGGPGFDTDEMLPTALVSFLLPFALWRRERRFGPDFLWTLPVDRRRLALAKVFAGGVWLMVALAIFVSWLLALGLLAGAPPARTILRIPFTVTIAAYLFGSALLLGLRHPLRWVAGAAGVIFLVPNLANALGQTGSGEWRFLDDARTAWLTRGGFTQWAITAVALWGAGLIALWAAASRHRERRRR